MMSNLQAIASFETSHLRIANIFWLASLIPNCNGRLENICEDVDIYFDEILQAFEIDPDSAVEDGMEDAYVLTKLIEEQKIGFLLRVEQPIVESGLYSWGHYRVGWIYADALDTAVQNALCWAQEVTCGDH